MGSKHWLVKLLIIWCLYCFHQTAFSSEWQIIPSTCIKNKPSELCRVQLSIIIPDALISDAHQVCFFLEQAPLDCVSGSVQVVQIPIVLSETRNLLITVNGQVVITKPIEVQSLVPSKLRRRVRSPWSFF